MDLTCSNSEGPDLQPAGSADELHRQFSFSLEGEDRIIERKLGLETPGFYVDVGAHHPFRYSNTALFYENGWRGVNIDANPGSMEEFLLHRPDDVNIETAIGAAEGSRQFFQYNDSAFNGIDNDIRDKLEGTIWEFEGTRTVETAPLKSLLKDIPFDDSMPNFLNVDVEGIELEVLQSNDWNRFPFQLVVVEQHFKDPAGLFTSEIFQYLDRKGYRLVAFTGLTAFYQRR